MEVEKFSFRFSIQLLLNLHNSWNWLAWNFQLEQKSCHSVIETSEMLNVHWEAGNSLSCGGVYIQPGQCIVRFQNMTENIELRSSKFRFSYRNTSSVFALSRGCFSLLSSFLSLVSVLSFVNPISSPWIIHPSFIERAIAISRDAGTLQHDFIV